MTLESDDFICVQEKVHEANQVVIVDLADANSVLRTPITADSRLDCVDMVSGRCGVVVRSQTCSVDNPKSGKHAYKRRVARLPWFEEGWPTSAPRTECSMLMVMTLSLAVRIPGATLAGRTPRAGSAIDLNWMARSRCDGTARVLWESPCDRRFCVSKLANPTFYRTGTAKHDVDETHVPLAV